MYFTLSNDDYKKFESECFIKDYEYQLVLFTLSNLEYVDDENVNPMSFLEIEFIKKLHSYNVKKEDIIKRYEKHCEETRKYDDDEWKFLRFIKIYSDLMRKKIFLEKKISIIDSNIKLKDTIEKEIIKKTKAKAKVKVGGKELNISERYLIVKKVFNIDSVFDKLNGTSEDKHKLLSIVLGCGEHTSRQLLNGVHQKRTPVRDDIVFDYLNELK